MKLPASAEHYESFPAALNALCPRYMKRRVPSSILKSDVYLHTISTVCVLLLHSQTWQVQLPSSQA